MAVACRCQRALRFTTWRLWGRERAEMWRRTYWRWRGRRFACWKRAAGSTRAGNPPCSSGRTRRRTAGRGRARSRSGISTPRWRAGGRFRASRYHCRGKPVPVVPGAHAGRADEPLPADFPPEPGLRPGGKLKHAPPLPAPAFKWPISSRRISPRESRRLGGKDFASAAPDQQKQIRDRIAWPERAAVEDRARVEFFHRFRDLTVSGFSSSAMGMADLPYLGNQAVGEWKGCDPEVWREIEKRRGNQ